MSEPAPEFSRVLRLDQIGGDERERRITADPAECAALAHRFGLVRIDRLGATCVLRPVAGGWQATGALDAAVVQSCVATAQDVPATVSAPFDIRFVAGGDPQEDEVELSEEECDVVPLEEDRIDLGEAAAQTLALSLDPYPRAPDAAAWLARMGVRRDDEVVEGGALAGLRDLLARR